MPTRFFEIRPQLLPEHREHFLMCHQQNMPGNELAVIPNVAETAFLVKVNCDEPLAQVIPQGLTPYAIYDLGQARALLETPEWLREFP